MKNLWIGPILATLALAVAAQAPKPATPPRPASAAITLVPHYHPGASYTYAVQMHSAIGKNATIDTVAEVVLHVLSATSDGAVEELRFTKFTTTIKADDDKTQASLVAQSAATDKAAVAMQPVRVKLTPNTFAIESRSAGGDYDQPVEMLTQLARSDVLPSGPVQVGSNWTRERDQAIPTMNSAVALHLQCSLTAVGRKAGTPTATIQVVSTGTTELPAGALPGSDELAKQGLVAQATVSFHTETSSDYRSADAVLLSTSSQTTNHMNVKLVGPSPNATAYDTDINSNSTVKLVKEDPGTPGA